MPFEHGAIYWTELSTHDVDAAIAYYKDVLGWSIQTEEMPDGPYHMGVMDGRPMAGIFDIKQVGDMGDVPSHWITYFAVDDVDASVKATADAGGQVCQAGFDVPQVGRIAIVKDPTGALLGLMTPAS